MADESESPFQDEIDCQLGELFVNLYYQCLDHERSSITNFYTNDAIYVWNNMDIKNRDVMHTYFTEELPESQHTLMDIDVHHIYDAHNEQVYAINVEGIVKYTDQPIMDFQQSLIIRFNNGIWKICVDSYRLPDLIP